MKNPYAIILVVLVLLGIIFLVSRNTKQEENTEGNKNEVSEMNDHDMSDVSASNDSEMNTPVEASVGVTVGNNIKEFTVTGENFTFVPKAMTVNKGDTVKIIFKNTQGFHDFVLDEFNVKSKQGQGPSEETLTFVADKVGSFEYYCSVGSHRAMGMKGSLIVK